MAKNVASKYGKTVTFMPKPLFGDNGSGMHTHQSLWKDGKPLFFGTGYAGLSEMALYYIGGILKHAPALCAICNPTNNSLQAAGPGLRGAGQPGLLGAEPLGLGPHPDLQPQPEGQAHRVPHAGPGRQSVSGQFAAMLMAGLDGILNKIHPASPWTKTSTTCRPRRRPRSRHVPDSLKGALEALEKDHAFLLKGGVFTRRLPRHLPEMKKAEYDAVRDPAAPVRVLSLLRRLRIEGLRRDPADRRELRPEEIVQGRPHSRGHPARQLLQRRQILRGHRFGRGGGARWRRQFPAALARGGQESGLVGFARPARALAFGPPFGRGWRGGHGRCGNRRRTRKPAAQAPLQLS